MTSLCHRQELGRILPAVIRKAIKKTDRLSVAPHAGGATPKHEEIIAGAAAFGVFDTVQAPIELRL